jgi:hypothetical protein
MLELPAEIKSAFEKGEFSIRQTSGSFNGIWSDMGTASRLEVRAYQVYIQASI